jgi:hypothetical protein
MANETGTIGRAATRLISSTTAAKHVLFALANDFTLWSTETFASDWNQITYGGTGNPISISATLFPGPTGAIFLFVLADDSSLWEYSVDEGTWNVFNSIPPS